ncbi:MAG TPA: heavy metal translocating P-type ATPase, partial [Candidatus Jeotgalicoccus stercoravium]|nr:heavy metal translocating P-type ATPase [Candidatus Jeotgalicoccus stercoravium]
MAKKEDLNLNITGMTCAACSNRIEKVLNKMDEVDATVNLTTEKASIQYDKDKVDPEDITKKINDLGYGVRYEQTELDITGMTCAACSSRIEKVLNKTSGVEHATVNLTTENAMIEYNHNM